MITDSHIALCVLRIVTSTDCLFIHDLSHRHGAFVSDRNLMPQTAQAFSDYPV
jgi:hypothetical protein